MKDVGSNIGGFENPTEGWHNFEVTDQIEWRKDKDGEATSWLVCPCKVIESNEEGRQIFPSFNLDKPGGQTDFAKFLYWTKTAPVLEKLYKISGDDTPNDWGKKYLDLSKPKCQKLIDSAISKLANKSFRGKVAYSDSTYTNDEGKEITRTYANLRGMKMYNDTADEKGGPAPKKEAPAAQSNADTGSSDDEEWG